MCSIISGVVTSLVTPFTTHLADGLRDTEPDPFAFEALLRWQARAGVSGVVVAGWAGEGPALTRAERSGLIRLAAQCRRSMALLVAIAEPSTARAVAQAVEAAEDGADALVLSLPFYNKPTVAGMHRHIEAVAEATRLPLLVELDPARTNLGLSVAQIAALLRLPRVAGLVDHTANPLHVECMSAAPGPSVFLAARDACAHAAALLGADGLVSTIANCAPDAVVRLWTAGRRGDAPTARAIAAELAPLVGAVEAEGVPALKQGLRATCGMEPAVRLPLHRASAAAARAVEDVLRRLDAPAPFAAAQAGEGPR